MTEIIIIVIYCFKNKMHYLLWAFDIIIIDVRLIITNNLCKYIVNIVFPIPKPKQLYKLS